MPSAAPPLSLTVSVSHAWHVPGRGLEEVPERMRVSRSRGVLARLHCHGRAAGAGVCRWLSASQAPPCEGSQP